MSVAEDSLPHTSGGNKRLSFLTELPIEDSDEESHQQSKAHVFIAFRSCVTYSGHLERQFAAAILL